SSTSRPTTLVGWMSQVPWAWVRRSPCGCLRVPRKPHFRYHHRLRSSRIRLSRKDRTLARVLVVEDEESFSDALSYMLRNEGFEVCIAANGPQALTEFARTGADIVLLDLMLPEMSGTEVCRRLRQQSDVPIIMVTARDSEIDKVVGLELGAD